jgi:hypothetical protein
MKGDQFFTLIHHLTLLDVELRPRDPIRGKLVAFEADMIDGSTPPRLVVLDGPARDLFTVLRPQVMATRKVEGAYARAGLATTIVPGMTLWRRLVYSPSPWRGEHIFLTTHHLG